MKKLIATICALLIFIPCLFCMTACGETKAEATRMTMDLNPSVEFMLDKDNKVVSVTALNDDGSVILYGENFIGKSAEEAAKMFMQIASETGYILKGNAEASDNNLKISISGEEDFVEDLYEEVEDEVTDFLEENNLKANVSKINALAKTELVKLVKKAYPEMLEEELNQKTEIELVKLLTESRKEVAGLLSNAMQEAYFSAKSAKINIAENEKIQQLISGANESYQVALSAYNNALTALKDAVEDLEDLRYQLLIDTESDYQKAVQKYLDAKKELNLLREKIDNGTANMLESASYSSKLTILEGFKTALDAAYTMANTSIDLAIAGVQTLNNSLEQAKQNFPTEIKTLLEQKTGEIETAVNSAKDNMFTEFETEYQTAITEYNTRIAQMKEALKNSEQ